jgi:hypothetical protein
MALNMREHIATNVTFDNITTISPFLPSICQYIDGPMPIQSPVCEDHDMPMENRTLLQSM